MAAEESEEMPMLLRGGRRHRDHVVVELSNSSTQEGSSCSSANERDNIYFSAPLPKSQSNRGRIEKGLARSSKAGAAASAVTHRSSSRKRFYSGPIIVENEILSSSIEPTVPAIPVRRRPHSHSNGHEHLLRSGPLGQCDDPFCTICPLFTNKEESAAIALPSKPLQNTRVNLWVFNKVKLFFGHAYSWGFAHMPGVMNPHTKRVQQWNKLFLISCLLAIFVDPLFFFILSVDKRYKCIYFNMTFAKVITVLRSTTDLVYLIHMLLQFRLAYIGPSSGIGLIDNPKEIFQHYFFGWFWLDFIVVLPLPQIIMWVVIPRAFGISSVANFTKNLLRAIILVQYLPRMLRFAPLLAGNSPTGFIFETAKANFFINLFLFLLVAHVVGSCWYLFGLQRVNQCLRDACLNATISGCNVTFLDCGTGGNIPENLNNGDDQLRSNWKNNANASQCFYQNSPVFVFGIYSTAVNVTVSRSYIEKYVYSLFWGFQQISTLAGNQVPSMFVGEIIFVVGIVILGLLLTVLLISNMQNFLISLNQRKVDMQLRRYDVECWMARRQIPEDIRKKIRQAERLKWAANKGLDEDELLRSLPEDIEKEIRRTLCLNLIKEVRLFTIMNPQVLYAICERLHQNLYIQDTIILRKNYPIEKMHFFVKGDLQVVEEDGCTRTLESRFCGEELLIWCLEKQSNQVRRLAKAQHAESSITVKCAENVEAFTLSAKDLQEVTDVYSDFLRNSRVQGALKYESLYWRKHAATCIQVKWRYFRRRRNLC